MTSDGKIYIVITDKLPTESQAQTQNKTPVSAGSGKNSDDILKHWAKNRLISEVEHLGMTAVNYQLSNIGNFTGDYIAQNNVNNALNAAHTLMGIGGSALAGFMVAGPIGAVIAGSISVINTGVNSALSIHSNKIQNQKTNYEIEQLRRRSGLNTTLDGSRGTEN